VKVAVVGGGPAGLYLAILLRKADRGHEVRVVERNPPEATFGWGVVFSEETLGELREADYESFVEIADTFARWNAIDVVHRGRVVRSRGHSFSAISRKLLLSILQRRAALLGVELAFETEAADAAAAAEADLVVAADGVNSTLRPQHAGALRPRLREYPSRYVWFGTDRVYDAFTFVFRETEWGMFQVHAYPFDAETSTFIVECSEETWRRAGLERQSEEETLTFCAELFAEHLGGARLLSNKSVWRSFLEVKLEHWHDGPVVLVGDAAHTAHFTIGSGTKLAMEDSIALASALLRHDDRGRALTEYELERRPVVERFQEAALDSARYFERVGRYADFEPLQFAFNLLTRSGRIGYTNLALRDPAFVGAVDASFAAASGAGTNGAVRVAPPPMFAPLRIGDAGFENRVVVQLVSLDRAVEGVPAPAELGRLAAAAASGAGLVVTEPIAVAAAGRITPGTPGLWADEHEAAWADLVAAVRRPSGARLAARLVHAGRRGATRPRRDGVDLALRRGGWPLVSASPIPYGARSRVPHELDRAGMDRVRDEFAAAARRAAGAGFDVLELDMGHGYLLGSFLSPLSNRREDEYGRDLEARLRFPLEVLDAVRTAWPGERILAVRATASDWARRGLTEEDGLAIAAALRRHGAQLLVPVAGQTAAAMRPRYGRAFLTPFSDLIRTATGLATVAGGGVTTADEVNTIVAAGRADLAVLDLPLGEDRE
jgi:anthraniloyl-CoA monooxygenase